MVRLAAPTIVVTPQVLSLPPETKTALSSTSVETVKQTLIANVQWIRPFICYWNWLWPFYYLHSDEITTVLTDKQGAFQTNIWYLCRGDHPDLYFWVEYQIGGAWTTVYNPGIYCGTHWNYPCGSQVTIIVSDPRVPWYSDPTPLPGKQIAVLSVGRDVSMTEIKYHSAGTQEGLTNFNEPFGGSLEPTIWFGDALSPSVTHYRWSYRQISKADGTAVTDSWHAIDNTVIRHYGEIMSDGTLVFKPYLLGPDPLIPGFALFKIPPKDVPYNSAAVAASWAPQVDPRVNAASAFFRSYLVGTNPMDAAGKYELKLELFNFDGSTNILKTLNFTDEGIALKVPTVDAPFDAGVVPTTGIPNTPATPRQDIEDRVFRDAANKISAFRLVLFVDNNPCVAEIYPTQVTGPLPGSWASVGTCGFIQYPPMAQAIISFKAAHPNNFATFDFTTSKGSSGSQDTAAACAPSPGGSASVADLNVNGYTRSPTSVYSKQMSVASLVGNCPNGTASFAENLSVWPLATDVWSTLWYLERYATPMAFALQPKGP